jgi:hypothetical protein
MVIRYEVVSQDEQDGQRLYYLRPVEARLLGQYFISIGEEAPRRLFNGEPQLLAADPGKQEVVETTLSLSGLNITGDRKVKKISDIF